MGPGIYGPLNQNGKCVDQFKWNLFCTVYVSFKYEWTKTTNKNHKNYISTLFINNAVWFVLGIVVQSDVWNPLNMWVYENSKREILKMNKNARLD